MPDHHDEWFTQIVNYQEWCVKYNIFPKLDVAASSESHMTRGYFTKEMNALTQPWDLDFWLNPPLLGD